MTTNDVHVCLLSDQPVPNLTPLLDHAFGARTCILAVSPSMRDRAHDFEQAVSPAGVRCLRFDLPDAYDIEALRESFLSLCAHHSELPLVLNVSGGTKPMAIAAYEVFRGLDKPIFYVQPYTDRLVWLFHPDGSKPCHALSDRIRIPAFLRAHGALVAGTASQAPIPKERRALCEALVRMGEAATRPLAALNYYAQSARDTLRSENIRRESPEFWDVVRQFEATGTVANDGNRLVFPSEDDRFFVNGGWLEEHVHGLLLGLRAKHPELQDVARSVRIEREVGNNAVRNEVDVMFLANNRLHIVECKTKRFSAGPDDVDGETSGADLLYKVNSLRDILGGLTTRALVVSFRGLTASDDRRAADLEVTLCSGDEVRWLPNVLERFLAG
jgi:hypothetical protein